MRSAVVPLLTPLLLLLCAGSAVSDLAVPKASRLRGGSHEPDSVGGGAEEDGATVSASASTDISSATTNAAAADSPRQLKTKAAEGGTTESTNNSNQKKKKKRRVVVRYKNPDGRAALLNDKQGLGSEGRKVYHDFDDDNVLVVDLDDDEIQAFALDDNIEAVEKDYKYVPLGHMVRQLSANETRHLAESIPYGVTMVQGDQVPIGPYGVKICVADTGVVHHPDLPTNMNGADRTSSLGTRLYWDGDKISHGTHTAGTVGAVKNNGIGVRGVAAGASLYITRAIDNSASARESDIYDAIKQCAAAGAQVISLSLGGGGMTDTFKALVNKLYYQNDIILVAAAGNNGKQGVKYPAAYPLVVGVGALSSDYSLWSGSNWGDQVELVAPGNLVLSTAVTGSGQFVYQQWSGTSMATPHVAAVAGLLRSYYPGCSNNQIRFAMAFTAKDLDDSSSDSWSGCDLRFGYGVVQAKSALNFLDRYSCASTFGRQAVLGGCGVTRKRNGN